MVPPELTFAAINHKEKDKYFRGGLFLGRGIKDNLTDYVHEHRRVCPKPTEWDKLYHMLPGIKRIGVGWEPPLPLILASWWDTTEVQKRDRLLLHINYAEEKGIIDKVDQYLRSLNEAQWVHEGEIN